MRRSWGILLCILVTLVGPWLSRMPVQASGLASATWQAPVQGKCDELQVVFVADQSGSMSQRIDNHEASDPQGLRFYGPQKAVEALSAIRYHVNPNATVRVALIHFGDRPQLRLPWTVLNAASDAEHREAMQHLSAAFAPIPSLGNTNFLAAYQNASSLFDQAPPQHDGCPARAVILMTDGQPALPIAGFSWQAHMKELADYVKKYMTTDSHQLYVIGIDADDSYWSQVKPYWDDVVGDSSRARKVDNQVDLASFVIDIAQKLMLTLKTADGGSGFGTECVTTGPLQIPPFVQQVKLRLIKLDPSLHLNVNDESGPLTPSRQDVAVTLEGLDEPIELMTVTAPRPGNWTVNTALPANAKDRCQMSLLSFKATGKLLASSRATAPVQFKRLPVDFKIVDSSGGALPDYGDPKYDLELSMRLVGASNVSRPMNTLRQPGYEYTSDVIPVEAGSNEVRVKAASHRPDGRPYPLFDDQPVGVFQVAPVRLAVTEQLGDALGQHRTANMKFAVVSGSLPVTLDLPTAISVTVTGPTGALNAKIAEAVDGVYAVSFTPDQAGRHELVYKGVVNTENGPVNIGQDRLTFDVAETRLIGAKVVNPVGRFVATDLFLRPTGLPLQVQLVSENGKPIGPGEAGATNPMALFGVKVLDARGNDVSQGLRLVNTGTPGLFRLDNNSLGPGGYQVTVTPASALAKEFEWSAREWSANVEGTLDPRSFGLVVAALLVVALIAWLIRRLRLARTHPFSGYIEVFQELPTLDGVPYRKVLLRQELPSNRNRVTVWARPGLLAPLLRFLRHRAPSALPFHRMEVRSLTEEDAKQGRVHVTVYMNDGTEKSLILDPRHAATNVDMTVFILKGPQRMAAFTDIGAAAEGFAAVVDRR